MSHTRSRQRMSAARIRPQATTSERLGRTSVVQYGRLSNRQHGPRRGNAGARQDYLPRKEIPVCDHDRRDGAEPSTDLPTSDDLRALRRVIVDLQAELDRFRRDRPWAA